MSGYKLYGSPQKCEPSGTPREGAIERENAAKVWLCARCWTHERGPEVSRVRADTEGWTPPPDEKRCVEMAGHGGQCSAGRRTATGRSREARHDGRGRAGRDPIPGGVTPPTSRFETRIFQRGNRFPHMGFVTFLGNAAKIILGATGAALLGLIAFSAWMANSPIIALACAVLAFVVFMYAVYTRRELDQQPVLR